MNEVNKTLFIPLYGKSTVSRKKIILKDPDAERIWDKEAFPIHGRSKSKWLAYNMAMRARVFDDWTEEMLRRNKDALVLHIGCGLDSRSRRVSSPYRAWVDCDLPDVISIRKKYYSETENYHMISLDASAPGQTGSLPDSDTAIVILEGISMYLSDDQLKEFFRALDARYRRLHILMDIYTEFGARASRYKNPVNDVGVSSLYGIDNIDNILTGSDIRLIAEHSFTPAALVNELKITDRLVFRLLFMNRLYGKIYRLLEFASNPTD